MKSFSFELKGLQETHLYPLFRRLRLDAVEVQLEVFNLLLAGVRGDDSSLLRPLYCTALYCIVCIVLYLPRPRHPAAELDMVLLLHDKHALRHAVAEALGRVLDKFDIDVAPTSTIRLLNTVS